MKKILGLDIGTNSIGGALIEIPEQISEYGKKGKIIWAGSRIIPLDGDFLQKFESGGQVETNAAARRIKRGSRRLKQRYILRRSRLIKVFKILGWIDESFPEDFKKIMNNNPEYKFKISSFLPFDDSTIEEATKLLGVENKKGKLAVSEDWIIYYLRKKALNTKITIKELARIIYMMNQRRGFKSGRKDLKNVDEENVENKWVEILTIDSVILKDDDENDNSIKKDKKKTYTITFTGKNYKWEVKRFQKPDWEGKTFKVLITKNVKNQQLSFRVPKPEEWELEMVAIDSEIENSKKHVGEFFFDQLSKDKNYKIRQQVIKRVRYQKELKAIWDEQSKHNPELLYNSKINIISKLLYKNNQSKQNELSSNSLYNLIANDIIYFQRELKSQKNSIAKCRYEKKKFIMNGEQVILGIPVAPKSCPEFQEFRIWQDIHNIRIFQNEKIEDGKLKIDVDVTNEFIFNDTKEKLFKLFDSSENVSMKNIFAEIDKSKLSKDTHSINLLRIRKELKGNLTKHEIRKAFKKDKNENGNEDIHIECEKILNDEKLFYKLWHILYSISSTDLDKSSKGIHNALKNEKNGLNISDKLIERLEKLQEFKDKQYASYSTKAIRKLLPLIRCGKYWNEKYITMETKERINKIINGEFDEGIDDIVRNNIMKYFKEKYNKELNKLEIQDFQGMPIWLACYVVYGIHSEKVNIMKYKLPNEINVMKLMPNNSLRNPIVEKVIRESLSIVKDLWKEYGDINEIHIELGRDLKNNADDRKKITEINTKNFEERQRIKKILYELFNNSFKEYDIQGNIISSTFVTKPNPESRIDIDKFKIWKDSYKPDKSKNEQSGIQNEMLNDLFRGEKGKEKIPTNEEIKKYALWISQGCISPYTGKMIQLSKLFSEEYEIEHIIPRSKLKYDSYDNLVICESGVNKLKDNDLARVFISKYSGQKVTVGEKNYDIFTNEDYETHCKIVFEKQYKKRKNLLNESIPENFISRQINDTRYINRKIAELLYPIVKDKEGVVYTSGNITNELKNNWGLNIVWKEILKPRFERLEKITGEKYIYPTEEGKNNYHLHVPQNPELDIKRIDHRHHTLDAIIIASTTREHIRYLNSLSAADSDSEIKDIKLKLVKKKIRDFILPWDKFSSDVKKTLEETIVTFKSNNKVITKPKNKYIKWVEINGIWKKVHYDQKPNKKWMAVRKSMFKEPLGIIYLKEIKAVKIIDAVKVQIKRNEVQDTPEMKTASYIYDKEIRLKIKEIIFKCGDDMNLIKKHLSKNPLLDSNGTEIEKVNIAVFNEYAAKRVALDKSFSLKKINQNIPYSSKSPIANLLRNHLNEYNGKPEEAFVGEGLDILNKKAINNPKIRKSIKTLTRFEKKDPDSKFKNKFVEVDAGSNVFFVIKQNKKSFESVEMETISVHKAIERIINNLPIVEKETGFNTTILSTDELVYVPTDEERLGLIENNKFEINWRDKKKISDNIYKMVKSNGKSCYFIHHSISKLILPYDSDLKKGEIESQNCSEKTLYDSFVIKNCCIKIIIDRLGNIKAL